VQKLQFHILYRQFLFRMVDLELLSESAQGDITKLLGQCAALLIFISVLLALVAYGFMEAPIPTFQIMAMTLEYEHFLIATTVLVVGLFAVLSWDSTFPNRLDVMVLAPLPVRSPTLFLAKVAALATALGLTVLSLHALAGIGWPIAFAKRAIPYTAPVIGYDSAIAPISAAELKTVLDRDLALGPAPGMRAFAPGTGLGASIAVYKRGEQRVFTYGTARPDSLFEIGSITKTFTALLLAQMVARGSVRLDQPVHELLPGIVAKPAGTEITLLDLATHHSGLPRMPDNFQRASREGTYSEAAMFAYLAQRGVAKPGHARFLYSNFGYALLGTALAHCAGRSYAELVQERIIDPLGLRDTVGPLSDEQRARKLQGYDVLRRPIHEGQWQQGSMAPSGYYHSSAAEMLAFLIAQLHPQGDLAAAIEESHKLHAEADAGSRIALAWNYDTATGTFSHGGSSLGYTAFALFNPKEDYAAVFLLNSGPPSVSWLLGEHIAERLAGKPAISLASVDVRPSHGFLSLLRGFAAYWLTMLMAGAFTFCGVLGLQGIASQVLPRRVFLRVSSFLQIAVLCGFVTLYFLEPSPTGLLTGEHFPTFAWLPSYWFVGLFQELNGSPAFGSLAARAWIGFALLAGVTAFSYLMSYFRTLRKIVEEPDIVTGAHGARWLPPFGNSLETAIVQFSIRTMFRSRQHRVMLAFFLGLGFALVILLVRTPAEQQVLREVDSGLLFATVAFMCLHAVGTRVLFSMPLALKSNWVFQVTQVRETPEYLVAIRRPLFVLAIMPVWLVSAALLLMLWPWRAAAEHLAVLGLLGITVGYLCLHGFQKIPFTCSYLPGKSYLHMAFLTAMGLLLLISRGVAFERDALDDARTYAKTLVVMIVAAIGARWRTVARANEEDAVVQFDDAATPAIQVLGLNRDGVVITDLPLQ